MGEGSSRIDGHAVPVPRRSDDGLVEEVSAADPLGGTADAFVADPGEEISPTIIDWVEKFVPDQVGEGKYFPHLTVGVATFDDLRARGSAWTTALFGSTGDAGGGTRTPDTRIMIAPRECGGVRAVAGFRR
jgi:hypothetical protein